MSLAAAQDEIIQDLPDEFQGDYLTPQYLASRFALCLAHPVAFEALGQALRDRLLLETVRQYRRRSDRLRQFLADVRDEEVIARGAAALPLMQRRDLEGTQRDVCLDGVSLDTCSFTSGSTSEPMIVYRSREEQAFVGSFVNELNATEGGTQEDVGVYVTFGDAYHGGATAIPSERPIIRMDLGDWNIAFARLLRLLQEPFVVNGKEAYIDAINAGGTHNLILLTAYLMKHADPSVVSRVKQVAACGRLMSRREYQWLKSFWPCPISNVFSMTEQFSTGVYCEACNGFHFDPFSIYEVVDVDSAQPLSEGRGYFAITGLYPLHQMMPFLRYLTGDLVDKIITDCPLGRHVYRPQGRSTRVVPVALPEGGRFLVSSAEVLDVLDDFPEVRRTIPADLDRRGIPEVGWVPLFRTKSTSDGGATVYVELRFDPAMFAASAGELRARIEASLAHHVPALAEGLSAGTVRVQLLPRGGLAGWETPAVFRDNVGLAEPQAS